MSRFALLPSDTKSLCNIVNEVCADSTHGLPCANVALVGDGRRVADDLFYYQKAARPDAQTGHATEGNDIYWLASCTKLVTAIACMQVVEKGLLHLDDADLVERLCPELKDVKVLQDGSLVEKESRITLRMLLTHTGK